MAIIKSHNAAMLLKEAIVLDLGDLRRQAQRLQIEAEQRAQQIVDDARVQATRLTDGGHDTGFEQGLGEGREQGLSEGRELGRAEALKQHHVQLEQVQQRWLEAAGQFDSQRQQLHREARRAVLELAIKLAEKVVHRVIDVNDSAILAQATAALEHVMRPMDVQLRMNPDDRPVLESAMPTLLAAVPGLDHLKLVDDASVARGGCVVAYGQGRIDATLDTQLRRLVELITPGELTSHRDGAASAGDGSSSRSDSAPPDAHAADDSTP